MSQDLITEDNTQYDLINLSSIRNLLSSNDVPELLLPDIEPHHGKVAVVKTEIVKQQEEKSIWDHLKFIREHPEAKFVFDPKNWLEIRPKCEYKDCGFHIEPDEKVIKGMHSLCHSRYQKAKKREAERTKRWFDWSLPPGTTYSDPVIKPTSRDNDPMDYLLNVFDLSAKQYTGEDDEK